MDSTQDDARSARQRDAAKLSELASFGTVAELALIFAILATMAVLAVFGCKPPEPPARNIGIKVEIEAPCPWRINLKGPCCPEGKCPDRQEESR